MAVACIPAPMPLSRQQVSRAQLARALWFTAPARPEPAPRPRAGAWSKLRAGRTQWRHESELPHRGHRPRPCWNGLHAPPASAPGRRPRAFRLRSEAHGLEEDSAAGRGAALKPDKGQPCDRGYTAPQASSGKDAAPPPQKLCEAGSRIRGARAAAGAAQGPHIRTSCSAIQALAAARMRRGLTRRAVR